MTDETDRAALGVSRSAAGQFWLMQENDDRQVLALSQRLGLPDLLCRMLASRGIDAEHAEAYLDPKLRDLLIDPSRMADMDKATQRLAKAIKDDEPIAVFGDYDVDGATFVFFAYSLLACLRTRHAILYSRPPERRLWPE
jgi:single-stranded-DNA-specific exonuclease